MYGFTNVTVSGRCLRLGHKSDFRIPFDPCPYSLIERPTKWSAMTSISARLFNEGMHCNMSRRF